MTADRAIDDGREGDCEQSKWIDALSVPAIVLPKGSQFVDARLGKRSLVVAASGSTTKRVVPGIVGDFGPRNELGAGAWAVAVLDRAFRRRRGAERAVGGAIINCLEPQGRGKNDGRGAPEAWTTIAVLMSPGTGSASPRHWRVIAILWRPPLARDRNSLAGWRKTDDPGSGYATAIPPSGIGNLAGRARSRASRRGARVV